MGYIRYGMDQFGIPDRELSHLRAAIEHAICRDGRTFFLQLKIAEEEHSILIGPNLPLHFSFAEGDHGPEDLEWIRDIYSTLKTSGSSMFLIRDPNAT